VINLHRNTDCALAIERSPSVSIDRVTQSIVTLYVRPGASMVIPVSEFMNLEFAHLFDFVDYFTNVDPSGKSTDRDWERELSVLRL
jgi:hypothetical protein